MLIFSRNNHGQFTDVDFVDVVVDVASLILQAYRPPPPPTFDNIDCCLYGYSLQETSTGNTQTF